MQSTKEQEAFEIMLEGVRAMGGVTGLRARTSEPTLREIFTKREVNIILKDITAGGNVTGVDLAVDRELELKKKIEIRTNSATVKFNPEVGKIIFGKGLKSTGDEQNNNG